ncbi:MAG: hypothetical protein K0R00_1335 [Herbinix sp.]|nr:hypothetical protein [Herbinix sp.]
MEGINNIVAKNINLSTIDEFTFHLSIHNMKSELFAGGASISML